MPLPLPDLDDRSYADLVEEALALIPTLSPAWTDFNASDPGITLVELFAWLTEMLLYRVDQVPNTYIEAFLKLLNGPNWSPSTDLDKAIRTSLAALRAPYRAITAEDYAHRALAASPCVARALCIPRRYLDAPTLFQRQTDAPGHVSVVILPQRPSDLGHNGAPPGVPNTLPLLQMVAQYLDPRRMATTWVHVVPPTYLALGAEILIARQPSAAANLNQTVTDALTIYLDPWKGGLAGSGWPFGRNIYVSELLARIQAIPGVAYVPDIRLTTSTSNASTLEIWNENGDRLGYALPADGLPWLTIDTAKIFVADTFIPVTVALTVTPAEGVAPEAAIRAANRTVKDLFHPLHGGPDLKQQYTITVDNIRSAVEKQDAVKAISSLTMHSDPSVEVLKVGTVYGVAIPPTAAVDAQIQVSASSS